MRVNCLITRLVIAGDNDRHGNPRRRRGIALIGCLGFALLLLGGPGLIFAGLVVATANPCWFKEFPGPECNASNMGPGSTAVTLWVVGSALLLLLAVLSLVAHAVRRTR